MPNPAEFVNGLKNSQGPEKSLMDFKKGTTTLAFKTKDGVCVAVDSRASMGEFNSSETVRKIVEINDRMLGTMAGGAADCQYWEPYIAMKARVYELKYGQKMSCAAASKLLSNIMYAYRGYGLSMGIMFTGWDERSGASLYYIDNDATRIEGQMFSVGSGQTFAYGVLGSYYSYDMSMEDAIKLGKRAISEATYNDAASGGVVRVYWLPNEGPHWIKIEDGADNSALNWAEMVRKGTTGVDRFRENAL